MGLLEVGVEASAARPDLGAQFQEGVLDAAEAHRRIYQAIRQHDVKGAELAMHDHLIQASTHQSTEVVAASRRARAL